MSTQPLAVIFQPEELSLHALKEYFKAENDKADERLSDAKHKIKTTFGHIFTDYEYSDYDNERQDGGTNSSQSKSTHRKFDDITTKASEKKPNMVKIGPDIISDGIKGLPISSNPNGNLPPKSDNFSHMNPLNQFKKLKESINIFNENETEKQLQHNSLFQSTAKNAQSDRKKKEKFKDSLKQTDANAFTTWSYTPIQIGDSDDEKEVNPPPSRSKSKTPSQANLKSWLKNLGRLNLSLSKSSEDLQEKDISSPAEKKNPTTSNQERQKSISPIPIKINGKSLCELSDVRCIRQIQIEDKLPIWCLTDCPNGEWLAAGTSTGLIALWRFNFYPDLYDVPYAEYADDCGWFISDNPQIKLTGHTQRIIQLCWSKESPHSRLLSSSLDWYVRLWEPNKAPNEVASISCTSVPTAVCFHPINKNIIFIGLLQFTVQVWKLESNTVLNSGGVKRILHGNLPLPPAYETSLLHVIKVPYLITSLSASPNGQLLAVGSFEGTIAVYDTKKLSLQYEVDCKNRRGKYSKGRKVTGIEWNKSGSRMCISTNDSRIRLLNSRDFSMIGKIKGHQNENSLFKAEYSPNERHVVSGSENGNIYVWNIQRPSVYMANWKKQKVTNEFFECFKAFSEPMTALTIGTQQVMDMLADHINIQTYTHKPYTHKPYTQAFKQFDSRAALHKKPSQTSLASKMSSYNGSHELPNHDSTDYNRAIRYDVWEDDDLLVLTTKFIPNDHIKQIEYSCRNFVFFAGSHEGRISVFINIGPPLKR